MDCPLFQRPQKTLDIVIFSKIMSYVTSLLPALLRITHNEGKRYLNHIIKFTSVFITIETKSLAKF